MKYKLTKKLSDKIHISEYKKKFYIIKNIKLEMNANKIIRIHNLIDSHVNINKLVDFSTDYFVFNYHKYTLLDFIELGVGMDKNLAQYFFKQMVDAIDFIHSKGICHRDLKPDNILIGNSYQLYLSDFDSATLIYAKCVKCLNENSLKFCSCINKEKRILKSLVGSYEYMSPEQFQCCYAGDTSDIWSLGIILLFCLTGTISWNTPHASDPNYQAYEQLKYHNYSPFNRLEFLTLKFVKNLLCINEKERITISKIKENEFYNIKFSIDELNSANKTIYNTQPNIVLSSKALNSFNIKNSFVSSQPIEKSIKRIYIPVNKRNLIKKMSEEYNLKEVSKNELHWNDLVKIKINVINEMCCVTFKKLKGSLEEYETVINEFISELKH